MRQIARASHKGVLGASRLDGKEIGKITSATRPAPVALLRLQNFPARSSLYSYPASTLQL